MAASDIINWKRLVNKLIFLNEEIELINTIIYDYNKDFQDYYEDFCRKHNVDINKLNKENHEKICKLYAVEQEPQDESRLIDNEQVETSENSLSTFANKPDKVENNKYEMTQDELEMHEVFTKLFKALALKLHPDKLSSSLTSEERDDMINKFNQAKDALEARKYFVLLNLASQLKVKSPKNYKQQIRWMKKEVEIMSAKVEQKKNTYNYGFSECENEQQKDNLIKKFIKHLFNISV